jgi:hypothetical protein
MNANLHQTNTFPSVGLVMNANLHRMNTFASVMHSFYSNQAHNER